VLVSVCSRYRPKAQEKNSVEKNYRAEKLLKKKKLEEETPAVQTSSLNFSYGSAAEQLVLENVGFAIPKGAKVGLLGRSGCGKSTLLKILARVYQPNDGGGAPAMRLQPAAMGHTESCACAFSLPPSLFGCVRARSGALQWRAAQRARPR
jgi:ABC-type transport system involved in cytochrome bd biosynthesis fused ATPase/permease subunit